MPEPSHSLNINLFGVKRRSQVICHHKYVDLVPGAGLNVKCLHEI